MPLVIIADDAGIGFVPAAGDAVRGAGVGISIFPNVGQVAVLDGAAALVAGVVLIRNLGGQAGRGQPIYIPGGDD